MSLLWIVRLITAFVSLLYLFYIVPWADIAIFFDPGLFYFGEGGHSVIVSGGKVGVCVTALASVVVAFLCIPRWRYGTRMLSWCFLLMGLSLLTRLIPAYWDRLLPWFIQINSYAVPLIFALPPLILAAILRQPVIEMEIQRTR